MDLSLIIVIDMIMIMIIINIIKPVTLGDMIRAKHQPCRCSLRPGSQRVPLCCSASRRNCPPAHEDHDDDVMMKMILINHHRIIMTMGMVSMIKLPLGWSLQCTIYEPFLVRILRRSSFGRSNRSDDLVEIIIMTMVVMIMMIMTMFIG